MRAGGDHGHGGAAPPRCDISAAIDGAFDAAIGPAIAVASALALGLAGACGPRETPGGEPRGGATATLATPEATTATTGAAAGVSGDGAAGPERELARLLARAGLESALDEPPSVWPSQGVVELGMDLEREETVAACVRRVRDRLAPEVAEAVADLGYDTFVEDLCGARAAVRAGDEAACDGLSVSTARRGCRRRLAVAHGRPEACPDDVALLGREPLCLAWAARDAGLCRALDGTAAARCEAVLAGDAGRCARLPPNARARCASEVARYGAALGVGRPPRPARAVAPELAFAVWRGAREDDAAVPVETVSHALDRGIVGGRCGGAQGPVVVRVDHGLRSARWERTLLGSPPELAIVLVLEAPAGGDGGRVPAAATQGDGDGGRVPASIAPGEGDVVATMGAASTAPAPSAPPSNTPPSHAQAARAPSNAPHGRAATRPSPARALARLRLPDGTERASDAAGATGVLTLRGGPSSVAGALRRGAVLEATFEVTLPGPLSGDAAVEVRGRLRTFVRDVVDDDPRLCAALGGR